MNPTRIEFKSLQIQILYEQRKNLYLQKVISVIDSELVLLETIFTHPERFVKDQNFKSDLHIIPRSRDLGIVALAEIVESLYLSQEILNNEGFLSWMEGLSKKLTIIGSDLKAMMATEGAFNNEDKLLDNQDLVFLLKVSDRTLQRYRDSRQLRYFLVRRKTLSNSMPQRKIL